MDFLTRVKVEENKLVHHKKRTVYECADHVNRSHNYICRISSLTEELPFPIEVAVPLMKFQGNYDLLKMLCWECGFAAVKVMRGKLPKGEENEIIAEFQRVISNAITGIAEYLHTETEDDFNAAMASLENNVEQALSIRNYIEKKHNKQEELF